MARANSVNGHSKVHDSSKWENATWWEKINEWFRSMFKPLDYGSEPMTSNDFTYDAEYNDSPFSIGDNDTEFGLNGLLRALIARLTGNELTGAQREANAFSASEAQKGRDFTEYMTRNKYQMETASMEEAGVNPAMVYGGGNLVQTASNPGNANSVSPGEGLNPFDALMSIVRMKRELGLLDAQIANTESQTEKNKAEADKIGSETDLIQLQVKYYPNLTEKEIEKFDSEIGVNSAQKEKLVSEKSLTDAKKVLQDYENKYADNYYALRNALEDATAHRELSREKLNDIQTALYGIEKEYMAQYHMKMGSSEAYSVCLALMSAFGLSPDGLASSLKKIGAEMPDWLKKFIVERNLPPHDGGSVGGGSR